MKASFSHLQLSIFRGKSRTKASFSHLALPVLKEVSHQQTSFSHFSHLQLQLLVVYARDSGRAKLRFAAKKKRASEDGRTRSAVPWVPDEPG